MKVCLIRPPQLVTKSSIGNKAAAPLGIAFLGAMLEKNGHKVTLIGGIAENPKQLMDFFDGVYVNGLYASEVIDSANRKKFADDSQPATESIREGEGQLYPNLKRSGS